MKKWITALLIVLCVVVIVGAILIGRYSQNYSADKLHFERGETELVIANQANASVQLFKAGKTLAASSLVANFSGHRMWLPSGNYFLQVEQTSQQSFYPVPLIGFQQGPEASGEFTITIRSSTRIVPPVLLPRTPVFNFIPSGHFLYGDQTNSSASHYVWQKAFFISPFEITNEEFRIFLSDPTGYNNHANWTEDGWKWKAENASQSSASLNLAHADFQRFGQADQPIVNVNWFEASAYCHWLTQKIGGNQWLFSLPTEAEWEKVARGPDNFDYGLGMNLSDADVKLYNWKKNPMAEVTVVGWQSTLANYQPNRYGVFHMTGNVAEWTLSLNQPANREHPYADDERNRESLSGARVVRGGSWYSASTATMYIPYRETFEPTVHTPYLGFRIVARMIS